MQRKLEVQVTHLEFHLNNWTYQGNPVTSLPDCAGFVYLITHTPTKKKYIGKKLARFAKTKYKTITLKNGKKRKQKIKSTIESDWQTYYGSSQDLLKDVSEYGTDQFTREILQYCMSKADCTYTEAKLQFQYDVLRSTDYYNKQISCRIHHSQL